VILVAHDRWFLEAVTTATLELEAGRATFFPGPWHTWRREKAARALHAQKEVQRVQADIVRLERFVERFRSKKNKAKQAQAKLTHIGRLEQERAAAAQEVELDARGSVLQCVQNMTGLSRPDAQSLLGRFLFSGWDAHEKPVSVLSGGERRRLALAVTVASGANFLVLDEPTNHLDLESREALEAALDAFPGTVLLVSHDRALLDAIAERTLAIEDGELRAYDGGWAELLRVREEREAR